MIEKSISEELKELKRLEIIEILADALKKQLPMTVTNRNSKAVTVMLGETAVCPNCGRSFYVVFTERNNCCSWCGQKLRWPHE